MAKTAKHPTIVVPADSLLEQVGDACVGFEAYHADRDNPTNALDCKQDALELFESIHHTVRALQMAKAGRATVDADARAVLRRWEVEGHLAHDNAYPEGIR